MPDRDVNLRLRVLPEGADRVQAALASVGKEADASQAKLDRLAAALKPENLSRQVKIDLQVNQAQKQYDQAYQKEAAAQGGGDAGGGGLAAALLPVAGIVASIVGAVQAANPAVIEQLAATFKDVAGVIGQTLTPVVQLFTQGIRLFGDFLASVLPSQAEMNALMKELQPIFDALKEVFQALAPILHAVVQVVIAVLVPVFRVIAWVVQAVATVFKVLLDVLRSLLGLGEAKALVSSRGAGAAPASFMGLEDVGRKAQEAAFSQGIAAKSFQEQTVDWLEKIHGFVETIATIVKGAKAGAGKAVETMAAPNVLPAPISQFMGVANFVWKML